MGPRQLKKYCALGEKEQALAEQIFHRMQLSARAYHRMLKVARTIADLAGDERITTAHLTEASCYRIADGKYWRRGKE